MECQGSWTGAQEAKRSHEGAHPYVAKSGLDNDTTSMLEKLFSRWRAPALSAATEQPTQPPPKVKAGNRTLPAFFTSAKMPANPLARKRLQSANTDITTLRSGLTDSAVLRDFSNNSPDLSAAVSAYLRTGIPGSYTAIAKNRDGTCNREGTVIVQQLLNMINVLPDYSEGFSNTVSIRSLSEQLGQELIWEGSASIELVLDKTRLPSKLQPVSTSTLEFIPKGNRLTPRQKVGSDYIDLDTPTFFYVSLDQDLLQAYSKSPFSTAVKPVLFTEDLLQDVHRIIKRVVHPRQHVTINEDKFRKFMSPAAQSDPELAITEMNALVAGLEAKVNALRPEDALVYFDSLGFEVKDAPTANLANEYETLKDIGNARVATGAKTLPAILGHGAASSNIASTETMLFVKNAVGMVTSKLDELYSKALTLAVRLYGIDCVVEFKFADVNLRPELELESFKQTKQMRILELLSFGFYSDDEASVLLTGQLPPNGFTPLSGTRFTFAVPTNNDPSAQGAEGSKSNSGSALNQSITSDAPSTARGKNK